MENETNSNKYCFVCQLDKSIAHIVKRTPGNGWYAARTAKLGDAVSPSLCGHRAKMMWAWLQRPGYRSICNTCEELFIEAEGYVLQES